jgi:hypothetical protein
MYDNDDNLIQVTYVGEDGSPVSNELGWAICVNQFDDNGNCIHESFYDSENKPVITQGGFSSWEAEYDKLGNKTVVRLFGTKGERVLHYDGYSAWSAQYKNGKRIKESYFSVDGTAIPIGKSGIVYAKAEYYKWNNIDFVKNPLPPESIKQGSLVASFYKIYLYKEYNNEKASWIGSPCVVIKKFNVNNDCVQKDYVSEKYLVSQGNERPSFIDQASLDGYIGCVRYEYDANHNCITTINTDGLGNPVYGANGYYRLEKVLQSDGTICREKYYDVRNNFMGNTFDEILAYRQKNKIVNNPFGVFSLPVKDVNGEKAGNSSGIHSVEAAEDDAAQRPAPSFGL